MFNKDQYRLVASFTVRGEPASKANSRRLVTNRRTGRPMSIKSAKALGYANACAWQLPKLDPPIADDVVLVLRMHYASRRPDMDESVLLDAMQGFVYVNDRQVKERHTYWALDPKNPRVEVEVYVMCLSLFP